MQKPFYLYDMEINQNAHQWDRYRLSLPRMQSIRNSSTHWRATCNFATKIMDFRDYIRTSFANIDFLVTPDANRCIWYEFVDIRDNRCQNCTVYSPYSSFYDYHIDSWWGNFCDFTARTGGVWNEDNFGFYGYGTVHLGALPRTRPQLNTGLAAINKTTKIGFYYPTSLRRVQIRPKTSTNITPYLYSRGPVRKPSTGSSKYGTTRKNAQRYYKTNRLISYLYSYMPSLMH